MERLDLLERERKPAPKEVLIAWAREWTKEGVRVDWEKLLPAKAFRCCQGGVDSGTDIFLDRQEQEDEQRLREVARE